ncbi:MAG: IclR family transcriptional regulator [Acidimicrobiales bacterium]
MQVLDRTVAVLEACEEGPASLADLVARTGLPRATAHRLARAMEDHGLLARDGASRWALGPAIVRLGAAAAAGPPLAEVARSALERLRDATGESVQLYVRRGTERLCIVSLESPHSLRTIVPVGAALPIDRGSAGRALRAGPVWQEQPDVGWEESVEEREAGVASVSVAVRDRRQDGGTVVAAVSVSGPIERTSRMPGVRYGPMVVEAGAQIERAGGLDGGLPAPAGSV